MKKILIPLVGALIIITSIFLTKDNSLGFAPTTGYSSRLTTSISSTVTTIPVSSTLDKDGVSLGCSTINKCYFNLEAGTSREEGIVCTGLTSSSFTSCIRGLEATGDSEVGSTTLQYAHNAGSKIIMTNIAQFFGNFVDILTGQTIGGIKTFTLSPIAPSPTTANQVAIKSYVDGVAIAGGATSTESVSGIGELATASEQANNTFDADNPTFLSSKYSKSTGVANYAIIADSNGELDPSFIGSNDYTFSGSTTLDSITTDNIFNTGTTTVNGNFNITGNLLFDGIQSTAPTWEYISSASFSGNSSYSLSIPTDAKIIIINMYGSCSSATLISVGGDITLTIGGKTSGSIRTKREGFLQTNTATASLSGNNLNLSINSCATASFLSGNAYYYK